MDRDEQGLWLYTGAGSLFCLYLVATCRASDLTRDSWRWVQLHVNIVTITSPTMFPILVIAVLLIPGNPTHFYSCLGIYVDKLFCILDCLSVSESLRCYAGKGGGKFQDCHPDFGYKTCFSKFENGKIMNNILMIQNNIFWRRLSDSTDWQASVWHEAARPRGRCCT